MYVWGFLFLNILLAMEKRKIEFEIDVHQESKTLPEDLKRLLTFAVASRKNAYAPYSNFHVGAAVLLDNGEVVIGNNQENASYPSGLCAERVAIFHAGAKYPNIAIKAVAISAASKAYVVDRPAAPCGNCRQAIAEYEHKQKSPIKIVLQGEKGDILVCNAISDLLPLSFDSTFLSES